MKAGDKSKKRRRGLFINNKLVEINFKKSFLFKRVLGFFLRGFIVSGVGATVMLLLQKEYFPCFAISIVEIIAFFVMIYFDLKSFRISIPRKTRYYKYNITAMAIYCAVATVFAMVFQFSSGSAYEVIEYIYTFPFCVFRALNIIGEYFVYRGVFDTGLSNINSALVFSAACLLFTAFLPNVITKENTHHHKKEATHHHDKENKD